MELNLTLRFLYLIKSSASRKMKRLWNSSFQSLFYRLKVQLLKILIFIPYGNCALKGRFFAAQMQYSTLIRLNSIAETRVKAIKSVCKRGAI